MKRLTSNKWLLSILLLGFWLLIYLNLKTVINWFIGDVLGLSAGGSFTEALRFFLFEVPKVLLLLVIHRKRSCRFAGYSHTLLFLLCHPTLYRFCRNRYPPGCDLFVSHFCAHDQRGGSNTAFRYVWLESGCHLYYDRLNRCHYSRMDHR